MPQSGIGRKEIKDGEITNAKIAGEAWTTYAVTTGNLTLGNGSVVGKYIKRGKTVDFKIRFSMGSTSSMGTGPTFSLPFANADNVFCVNAKILDAGSSWMMCFADPYSQTVAIWALRTDQTYINYVSITSTVPITWTTNDEIYIQGRYEST